MTSRGKRTIAICAGVAVAGAVFAGGSFTGDSAGAIAGYLIFVLAIVAGIIAALLGDRSNLSGSKRKTQRSRLPRPGFVAIGLSSLLGLIALAGLSQQMPPTQCASVDLPPTEARLIPGTVSFDSHSTRAFPPGRICRGYALAEGPDGTRRQVFIGEEVVPGAQDYFAALFLVLAPLALSMGWRATRARMPGQLPATSPDGA
jgi:hypothetical protein